MIPVLGSVGAAVDYSRAVQASSRLQAATDAAALSSVAMKSTNPTLRNQAAHAVVRTTAPAGVDLTVDANVTSKEGDVRARATVKTSLLQVLGIPSMTVAARSKAVRVKKGPPPCILALNPSAPSSIDISGSAVFEGVNCVLHANSSATGALSVGGSAKARAAGYCAVGTVSSYYPLEPEAENGCDVMEDTYAGLKAPLTTACTPALRNVSVQPNQTKTLQPGVYCGGLDLKGNVTLAPGLYVIRDGSLSMNSSGTIVGNGVTFYLYGSNAGFDLNGGSKLELSAMTTGDYKGLLLVQDRASNVGGTSKINGNSGTLLKGAIYAPTQTVRMNGSGTFGQASPFMPLIADRITITGNATAKTDATNLELAAPLPQSYSGARLAD